MIELRWIERNAWKVIDAHTAEKATERVLQYREVMEQGPQNPHGYDFATEWRDVQTVAQE